MSVPPEPPPDLDCHRSEMLRVANWLVPQRLRHRLDPEDLVQKTFEEVLRKPLRLIGMSAAEVGRYLLGALRNNATDELRRRDPHADVPAGEFVDSSMRLAGIIAADQTSPSGHVEQAELFARLVAAVAALPDAQRVAVEMRFWCDLSGAEIGRLLNRSEGAAATLLNRALKALRGALPEN